MSIGALTQGIPLQSLTNANDPASIREAAQKLEGAFAQMLIKNMRSTTLGDSMFPGASEHYRDLYDQQVAAMLTRGKGLGLAPMIEKQLGGNPDAAAEAAVIKAYSLANYERSAARALPAALAISPLESEGKPIAPPAALQSSPVASTTAAAKKPTPNDTRQAFVAAIWPQACKAAAELGVCPKVLVAQAALETGWGEHLPKSNGHNLFGIKATSAWQGARSTSTTHEFVNGASVRQTAQFRDYGSADESFADYVQLLKNSPRYAQALGQVETRAFANALQRAGYASDPQYAAKLTAIAEGPTLNRALAKIDTATDSSVFRA